MEEEFKGLGDYLAILGRRKKELIFPALVILMIAIALAAGLPSVYRSEATILIEQQEIPTDLVRSTVTSYAGERIQIISQKVMTTDNLSKIIENYGLYKKERAETSLSMLVEKMREEVALEMISADVVDPRSGRASTATIAFKLAFNNKNPRVAQKVTNELVSLYLNENLRRRTQSAIETSGFLALEAEKLNEEVSGLETRLAQFKERNINNLPELQQLNIRLMERTERELRETDLQLRTLAEREIYLQSELAQISSMSTLYSADGRRVLGAADRLKGLQAEFVSLKARYSPNHPDLIKMGKEIEALKKETGAGSDVTELQLQLRELKAEMTSLGERYSPQHPDVKKLQRAVSSTQAALDKALNEQRVNTAVVAASRPDNPAYIQLQAQLNAIEGESGSLSRSRRELTAKIDDFEQRLLSSPQVEREYRELTRDYDNAITKYREVKAKQQQAELAESLERERKGERFTLIEPPQLPEKPDKPNRLAILFLGFVFSIAGGIGTVAVAESLNDSIKSADGLVSVIGVPPLVVIPYIENVADQAKKQTMRLGIVATVIVLGIGILTAFHFLFMPLDVAWFVILRRLGLAT